MGTESFRGYIREVHRPSAGSSVPGYVTIATAGLRLLYRFAIADTLVDRALQALQCDELVDMFVVDRDRVVRISLASMEDETITGRFREFANDSSGGDPVGSGSVTTVFHPETLAGVESPAGIRTLFVPDHLVAAVERAFSLMVLVRITIANGTHVSSVASIPWDDTTKARAARKTSGDIEDLLRATFGVDTTLAEIAGVIARHHADTAQSKWEALLRTFRHDADEGGWGGYAPNLVEIKWLRAQLDEIECAQSYAARAEAVVNGETPAEASN